MKRRKTIYAGRRVYSVVYTVASPRDDAYKAKKIRKISSAAVARINCNTAVRKLEHRMYCGFEPDDLVITLTYRDADLPTGYAGAQKCLAAFLRLLRRERERHGQELRYIYCTEGKHGDHRLHHHLILNSTGEDIETIRSLWRYGDEVDLSYIHKRGYRGWAEYLSKERRDASLNGKRMYVCSRNVPKPEIDYEYVDDSTSLEAPPGAQEVIESGDRNEFASFRYIEYTLPEWSKPRGRRQPNKADPFYSDSKSTVTTRQGCRKRPRPIADRR